MLHKYECEKCGSVCYTESEAWESCPICEETPAEWRMRERAEQAEKKEEVAQQEAIRASEIAKHEQEARERDERERDEIKEESKILRRQRESYKKERDELLDIVHDAGVALYWMLETPYDRKIRHKAFIVEQQINDILEKE